MISIKRLLIRSLAMSKLKRIYLLQKHGCGLVLIGRLSKRNVMTYGYSSKLFGFQDQLIDDIMRPLDRAVKTGDLR